MARARTGSILAHWQGYQLTMRCIACGWSSSRNAAGLIADLGDQLPIEKLPGLVARQEGCRREDCTVGFDGAVQVPAPKPIPPTPETIGSEKVLRVNELREWHVVLAICPCGHRSPVDIKAMVPRMRNGRMLMASQFVCRRCGNREGNRFSVRMMAR